MGNLNNGLFGSFHGRVGNLVGYTLNGKNVIRTIGKSNKPPTLPKLANFQRMTVVNNFLRPLQEVIKVGYRNEVIGTDRNTYNEALSYHKKHALKGEYPEISLDYPKAMLSKGPLPFALNPSILKVNGGIQFQWEVPADMPSNYHHDRAMTVLLFPEEKIISCIYSGSRREEGKEFFQISPDLSEKHLEAYLIFVSYNGQQISDSVYAGSFAKVAQPLHEISLEE